MKDQEKNRIPSSGGVKGNETSARRRTGNSDAKVTGRR